MSRRQAEVRGSSGDQRQFDDVVVEIPVCTVVIPSNRTHRPILEDVEAVSHSLGSKPGWLRLVSVLASQPVDPRRGLYWKADPMGWFGPRIPAEQLVWREVDDPDDVIARITHRESTTLEMLGASAFDPCVGLMGLLGNIRELRPSVEVVVLLEPVARLYKWAKIGFCRRMKPEGPLPSHSVLPSNSERSERTRRNANGAEESARRAVHSRAHVAHIGITTSRILPDSERSSPGVLALAVPQVVGWLDLSRYRFADRPVSG